MLQNPLSYDTPNCGNAISKIAKRQVSKSSEGGSLSAITLFQAAARVLPGFGKHSKNNQEGNAHSSKAKELSVFCSNQSSILHFKYFYMEKRSDSREFLLPVLAQAYSTAESWPLDKTSVEVRCRLVF